MSVVESKDSKNANNNSSSSGSESSSGESSSGSSSGSDSSESESSDSEYSGESSDDSEESDSDEKPESNENDKKLTKDRSSDVPPWTRDVPESAPAVFVRNGLTDSAAGLSPNQTSKLQGVKEKSAQHKSVTFKDFDDLRKIPHNSSTESITKKQLFKDSQVQKETDDTKKNTNKCKTVEVPDTPSEVVKHRGKPDPVSKPAPVSGDRVIEMAIDNLFDNVKVAPPQDQLEKKEAGEDPGVAYLESKDLNSDSKVDGTQAKSEDLNPDNAVEGTQVKNKDLNSDSAVEGTQAKSEDLNSDNAVEDIQSPDKAESKSKDPDDLDTGTTAESTVEQFCFCKGGEYGLMIQCENCSEWYHDECLQMSKQEISNIETFICSVCQKTNKKLVTVFKDSKDTENTDKDSVEIPDEGPTETVLPSEVNAETETPSCLDVPEMESSKTDISPKSDDQVSEINQEAAEKGSSDEEWVDIAVEKDADSKTADTEPCVNFIARTKEMLAKKNLEPEKKELLLPVTSPMDLKRNEFWDENFYKPHINEDLSSCFSQMSIDWENAKKIFCHSTISPLKKDEKNKVASPSENRSRPSPKTPLKGSAQNTKRELLLKDPTTPTRTQIVPSPADPEVMKIFERSLLVSPCKRVVRPKEKPSRRISLVKLDDKVTMNFGKSPSPTTAREMGKKLFSGKHDWSTHNSNEKENSSPKTSKQPQRSKLARKPLFSDKPLDPAWAKGLDEINSDYPFYSLKKSQASELKKTNSGSTENTAKSDSLSEKSPERVRENSSSKESLSKLTTTPKKSKIDDSHLFKTPTKSVRRMRKKSVSSDRQSEGWSPGAKLLEHSCPYDPTESGCYSQTVESNTPIKVPLAPSLDSIIKSKPESCNKNEPKDRQDGRTKRDTRPGKSDASIETNSMDLSRSFDLEFDDCNSNTQCRTLETNQSNVTVKTILPKLLSHLEKSSSSPQRPAINEIENKRVVSDSAGDAVKKEEADPSPSSAKSPEISMETSASAVEEISSPSKSMRDVPSFIETPVEETLDFEENVASPATSAQKVLIGYGSEFCDEGEVFSSDDEESVMYDDIREAQRNALCDSPEIPASELADAKAKVSAPEGRLGDLSIRKEEFVSAETQKLLEDEEFLLRNKAKYGLEKQKEFVERSIVKNTSEKSIANITPNKPTIANENSENSMPSTSFKPIDDLSVCSSFENEVKRPIASTPRKSVEERCDTPLSALHHDQEDKEVAEEFPTHTSTVPTSHVEKFPKDSSGANPLSSGLEQSVQSRSKVPATDPTDAILEPVTHEAHANELSASISNILRSCESLSNPSIERTLPLTRKDQEMNSARDEDPLPSVTDDVCKGDHTSGIAKLLSSEEKMDDYSPAGTIHSTQITKTPLSAAVVRTDVDDSLDQVHKEADIPLKPQLGDSRPQEGGTAVNMLLSSEETMSNWTPEPSPTETSSSDPLGSIPAKRRISLHDYVIRKEATSCTPTLPESSFSTPDFAKSKPYSADIGRPESPLAVEHDSSNFERTQSPVPMDHDGKLPQVRQDAPIRKRGELVAKLKYHHLIPIHIPPREFLYCKRVKVIQNMLINELISGVEFKNHQPITQPLYGSIAEVRDTSCQQQCPLPGVPPRSAIRSSSSETNLNKHSTADPRPQHRQLPAPAENIKTPATSTFKTPSCSTVVLPSQDAPVNLLVNQEPQPTIDVTSRPLVPGAATSTSVSNNSGMGDPSVYDEESHDYFKYVKIPKVKRVTDTFMSDSSVLNSYDCGPDTLAVGQMIQQSIASDASSIGLDSINLNASLSNSQSALNKSQTAVDDLQTASTATIPKTISDLVNSSQDDRLPAGSFSTPSASSKNSADLDKITSYVKQCLFSEEGISRSPILPEPNNPRVRSCSTPNPSRPKTSFTIRHPSFSSANTTNKTRGSFTTDLTPNTALDARTIDSVTCELPIVCSDYEQSSSITPFPAIPKEEEDYTEPVVPTTETAETPIMPAPEPIKEKPPKYKIPKKKKPASAPPASSSSDPLLTSPNSIKKFISCSSAEPPPMSTLFTQRKKKQLDEILSKERAQREQVLQEYLLEKDEAYDLTDEKAKKSENSVKENVASFQTRKRRKTDSPEPPQQFDLRQVLSSKSSAKPECKRAKHKSGETNKSDDTRKEDHRSERNRVRSDESNRRKSGSTREKDPQLGFKSKLFDALAVLNTRERNLRIPDKMAGRHVSLAHWLDSWKEDEIKLKELRTSRLQIRDPNYQPRDLSKLKLSQVCPNSGNRPRPAKKMAQPSKLGRNVPNSKSVFGWKDRKPDSCNVNLFPAQSDDASLTKPLKTVSTVSTSVSNPLLNKSNPLVKKKAGKSSDSKIPAPKIWVECMKRADEAHCNPKQIRKKTVLDIMTTKENGPLSTLQRALSANLKVTVVTRTFKGVRGECTGYLVAYDRYMNLALSDVTEHYRSLYHKQSDPEATEPTTTVPSSDDKFQSGPAFVDFKRSVTVTFNQDVLREIRSPSQSPDRAADVEKPETREEYRSRDVESRDQTRTHDETRSPGASIRSPSLSPPPSETSSPAKIPSTNKKHKPPPGLLGWANVTPDYRKFKHTKNCITTRHCKQVFLRGDNVVLVRLVE